ncbi:hypothetical protein PR048_020304 [Dryococelus australis]|uniref:Mutator-like transposase domain-containing protein n=1 Tax=Dryococelus australis TaxID=614101 RepID=A0ABQ9H657_9NEOP|nr:hypothetical protein PR048_020304 [Dryococelus australis]
MEFVGATALCARSEQKLGLCYVQYLGDGDSKDLAAVLQSKPCGNNVDIIKTECVGHVQKCVGTRLRRLKRDIKRTKLSDSKNLGGKGRLTDAEIDQLQRYYGQSIKKI